jgi:predicted HAD superfamily Cof-like phosphohydrolase
MKKGQLAFIHKTKQKGRVINIDQIKQEATIEIIVSQDKEQGTRTTKLETHPLSGLSEYRSKPKKYNPDETFYMVREFHKAFGHPQNDKPTAIPLETALPRAIWTGEELVEFLYATVGGDLDKFDNAVVDFIEGVQKAAGKIISKADPVDDIVVAQADALTDVAYFNQGSFTVLGVKPFNLFKIVQDANMGKLWDDGKPRFRDEDGKIVKPPHWEERFAPEPKLKAEIERQSRSL